MEMQMSMERKKRNKRALENGSRKGLHAGKGKEGSVSAKRLKGRSGVTQEKVQQGKGRRDNAGEEEMKELQQTT